MWLYLVFLGATGTEVATVASVDEVIYLILSSLGNGR
jgi:hypothetical protein